MRTPPEWLISGDDDYVDHDLGNLKSGKEAEIFVVERTSAGRSCLLAHKRYRPRSVTHKGELAALGFQNANRFMHDLEYRDGRKFAKSRDRRAVERMTNYGRTLLTARWTGHEFDVMRRAWEAGVQLPYPVAATDDGLLMQYLGDRVQAAPRLAQARLDPTSLGRAAEQLIESVRRLAEAGFVHADLSAYNVLWWQERAWLIDFPQAVDVTVNPHALEFLHRDLSNVSAWFARRGVALDPDVVFAELLSCFGR